MKKSIIGALIVFLFLLGVGCAIPVAGLNMVYKHKASGDIVLAYEDGTTKRVPIEVDGAALTGVIDYWEKNSGGLSPSALALVQVKPDGTFDIKWVNAGPGMTHEMIEIVKAAIGNNSVGSKLVERLLPNISESTVESTSTVRNIK